MATTLTIPAGATAYSIDNKKLKVQETLTGELVSRDKGQQLSCVRTDLGILFVDDRELRVTSSAKKRPRKRSPAPAPVPPPVIVAAPSEAERRAQALHGADLAWRWFSTAWTLVSFIGLLGYFLYEAVL
jgi:hypothetical protein